VARRCSSRQFNLRRLYANNFSKTPKGNEGEKGPSNDGLDELQVLDAPQILEEFMDLPIDPRAKR
jgi:hypothetical protein